MMTFIFKLKYLLLVILFTFAATDAKAIPCSNFEANLTAAEQRGLITSRHEELISSQIKSSKKRMDWCVEFDLPKGEVIALTGIIGQNNGVGLDISLYDVTGISGNVHDELLKRSESLKIRYDSHERLLYRDDPTKGVTVVSVFIKPKNKRQTIRAYIGIRNSSARPYEVGVMYKTFNIERVAELAVARTIRAAGFAHMLDCWQDNCSEGLEPTTGSLNIVNLADTIINKKSFKSFIQSTAVSTAISYAIESPLTANVMSETLFGYQAEILRLKPQQ